MKIVPLPRFFIYAISFTAILLASQSYGAPPIPYRIGGSVTVDGKTLTLGQDSGFVFEVISKDGQSFAPRAIDTDGLNKSDWYVIDIPSFDPKKQHQGGKEGESAIIQSLKDGKELIVISPKNGAISIGASGSANQIDLILKSETK